MAFDLEAKDNTKLAEVAALISLLAIPVELT
jgi:hypothetical protein